jgi:AsmA-like C-terminal region
MIVHCAYEHSRFNPWSDKCGPPKRVKRERDIKGGDFFRWIVAGVVCLALLIGVAAFFFLLHWPFTEKAITQTLENRFARQVVMQSFHGTWFPPGCVAEGVSFLHRQRKDLPPLITLRKLVIKASYAGLIRPKKRVARVEVVGLRVTVPPSQPGVRSPVMPLTGGPSNNSIGIDEMVANDAVLEFIAGEPGKEPFKLIIQKLVLDRVAENGPVSFHAALTNTKPPAAIAASGQFGPWNPDDPGATLMSGSYALDHGNLAVFHGVSGMLSSKGNFNGSVRQAKTAGTVDVRNFHVDGSSHTAQLSARFQANVDAENGNVSLESVESQVHRTIILSRGDVATQPGQKGKTVRLDMSVNTGRVEDLLLFFTSQKQASMTGSVKLHAKVELPPGPGFLKKLRFSGDFGVSGGEFTNPRVQTPLNRVSETSNGKSKAKAEEQEDPRTVLSNLKGHVEAQDGIATLSGVSFAVPGGFAQMRGTFNLLNRSLAIQGVLQTDGKLSDATSGFKALVLKVVTPFMKKNRVTIVPFTIKGTSSHPEFKLDLDGKRKL